MTAVYRISTLFFVLLLNTSLLAQTNSVELKSGTGTLISAHNSIATAFAAVPVPMTQAYIIELTNNYTGSNEVYPINFTANPGASSMNTLTLRPASNTTNVIVGTSNSGATTFQLSDADYVIIDGRPGGEGVIKALTFQNMAGTSSSTVITLTNGASHNLIRYCNIVGTFTGSNSTRGIFLGTSTGNSSGNSFNRIEHCYITGSRNTINSSGTTGSSNTHNVVFGCALENPGFAGIWLQAGTGYTTIDSNQIYSLVPSINTSVGLFGLVSDGQVDTFIITRNHFYSLNVGSGTITVKAINLRSFNANGTTYSLIANNIIALDSDNPASSLVTGIDFGSVGSNPSTIDVFYNSVRISGLATAGSSGSVYSAALHKAATGALALNVKNNLLVNTRSGGVAGAQHLALSLLNTTGTFSTDFNSYNATSGDLARLGGTVYPNFISYQAAAGAGNDLNSNDFSPSFVSTTNLRLQAGMIALPSLQGTTLAAVNRDIDNSVRVFPYRGAHELAAVFCSGQPVAGNITTTAPSICLGDSTLLRLNGQSIGAGLRYQWLSRPTGGNFSPITGATNTSYQANLLTVNTDFRCIVSCDSSGLSDTTAIASITVNQQPIVTGISYTAVERTHTFTAVGASQVNNYLWSFGDGNSSTDPSPVHTYPGNGNFTVRLIYSNACDEDTVQTNVSITVGVPVLQGNDRMMQIFPNPATDFVSIKLKNAAREVKQLQLFDLTGRLLITKTLDFSEDEIIQLPIHTLPAGHYQLRMGDEKQLEFHSLTKLN